MAVTTSALRRYPELEEKTFLVCIGAAKCATSWLYHYLDAVPNVATSPLKELHFFNARFPANNIANVDALALSRLALHMEQPGDRLDNLRMRDGFQASLDRVQMIHDDNAYFAHFARLCLADTRCVCDLTPAYATIGVNGLRYLRDMFRSQGCRLRLLYIMRDPVDRYWSQIRHLQQINPADEPIENWQMALTAPPLVARADYQGTVSALDAIFSTEDLLYLFYETLFDDGTLSRLCDHIGVPFVPGAESEPRNETKVKRSLPGAVHAALHAQLAPQYAFCRDRFGAAIPSAWRA